MNSAAAGAGRGLPTFGTRYRVDRELGHGGMATVYLAQDLKLHRQVALKVLRPELAASLGNERFLREIEIAARLSHPHILPLYDSGGRQPAETAPAILAEMTAVRYGGSAERAGQRVPTGPK